MTPPEGTGYLTTDELFRQHGGFVARFLARLGVPSDQLEDALQEVFLVAHRNGGYRPGLAKPASYLANIAIRAAAQHRRRAGLARQRHSDAALDLMPGESEDPSRAAQTRQDLERLQRALQRLPEELCTTLLLVEMEGESCVSVAAGLGCPVGTIYWRLHQARKELRAALQHEPDRAPEPLDARAQPARSWMILFGLDGFDRSEGSRLLQLARARPAPVAIEALVARHHELVRAGAELPAWASGVALPSASWLSVLGIGPILGVVAGGAAITASVIALQAPVPTQPESDVPPPVARTANALAPSPPIAAPPTDTPALAIEPSQDRAQRAQATRTPRASTRAEPNLPAQLEAALEPDPVLDVLSAAPAPERAAPSQLRPPARRPATLEPEAHAGSAEPQAAAQPSAADERIDRALSDEELAEMRAIARAERSLKSDPKHALALTRAMAAGFPKGHFHEERAYLEVMALAQLKRTGELRDKGAAFLSAYPSGLYSERVRKALASQED